MASDKIGKRIRTFRERKELTIEAMSERTGLDVSFLESLESDDVYPSLGPLLKVSRALGLRLGTFLDDQEVKDPVIVKRAERTGEALSMSRGKNAPADLKFYSLGKGKVDRHMEPFFIEIFPASAEDKKLSSHEGEEFIIVRSGKLEVIYGPDIFILEQGDSIYLNSIVPHHVGAAGDEKCEIHAVLYFPQ